MFTKRLRLKPLFSFVIIWMPLAMVAPVRAETVIIGTANTATDVGFYLADARGYFREAGIEPKMVPFNSAAQMVAPLGTGQLDAGGGTVAAGLYNGVARGINLRIVADKGSITKDYEYSTLVIRKSLADEGKYKSLADLKGLKLAAAAQGAGSESALNEALKKGGLLFADINVVHMGFPEMLAAMSNKAIDGGVTNEPTLSLVLQRGIAVRASQDAIYPGQQTAVVLYSEQFMRDRRALAEKFMVAYVRAIRDYNSALKNGKLAGPGAEDIIKVLVDYTPVKDPNIYRQMSAFAVDPDGKLNLPALDNDLSFFRERGLISDAKLQAKSVVDSSFLEAAVAKLGPYKRLD